MSFIPKCGATQPEVATPTPECPNPSQWSCYDGMGTEVEILEFLYGLVRMMRPEVIIETGSYLGFGTTYLAWAVRDNGKGLVHSAEPDVLRIQQASEKLKQLGLSGYVSFYQTTGISLIQAGSGLVDFAFLDSNLDTRIEEMEVLYPKLTQGGIVVVHDTNTFHDRPGANGPRTPMLKFAEAHGMQVINFDTPRGLMLLRKWKQ